MGSAACKCWKMSAVQEDDLDSMERKVKKPRLEVQEASQCPHASQVLENIDLLGCILAKLGDKNGLTLEQKSKVSQVSKVWKEAASHMPVSIIFSEPMSGVEMKRLRSGITGLRSLEFVGPSERHAENILNSWQFQQECRSTLHRLINFPSRSLQDAHQFTNLRTLSICRCGGLHVMELIQGIVYDLKQLSCLTKLQDLSLKEIGSQTASIVNLDFLPSSLKQLRLEDTSFVHHPELKLPSVSLESLHVSASKGNKIVLPVGLVGCARSTHIQGQVIHLTGPPLSVPTMEEDTLEVVMGHGILLLLAIGVERTEHETDLPNILKQLTNNPTFERLCIQLEPKAGSEISLVSRSDCRKDMKWKSLDIQSSPNFVEEAVKACKAEDLGLTVCEQSAKQQPQVFKLWRSSLEPPA